MKQRKIVILGSTGSIGKSTVDVLLSHRDRFEVRALAAHSNADLLAQQYRSFLPEYLCLVDPEAGRRLREQLKDEPVTVLAGEEEMIKLASLADAELVVNAVVGAAGLRASVEAIENGKMLALANKESLVAGGPLFSDVCRQSSPKILPIDSEHSAVWQALAAGRHQDIRTIMLTASGGPFRTLPYEEFSQITVDQALKHPTWDMGPRITIDSATLVNKGLEVLEAVVLFYVPPVQIEVVIKTHSIIK